MTDISREAEKSTGGRMRPPDKIFVNQYCWYEFPEGEEDDVPFIRKDLHDKLVAAAKQVIDEIEPHGHWHCVDALKDALEEVTP